MEAHMLGLPMRALFVALLFTLPALAQQDYVARTAGNPEVAVEELELQLKPLLL
jgi:hypothetical protein